MVSPTLKADTHEGLCSRSMLQGHDPGAKVLRVCQRFHRYTSSSGAEFPPRKMLHDIYPVKYLGASSRGKLSELENPPSVLVCTDTSKMNLEHAPGAKPLVCIGLKGDLQQEQ